ncbi:MAG TPA: stage II sporulation protein M [Candidatus Pacearchaeota archaeon]|nr:stage II sporulation protein M [Candidatus Pacearchaeota archaeon]HOK94068.1 stage II sporulation protein M [Candidatus Pacearchaeota archaeon]HPO75139.1 stage II sporulation protein M [Candidatus Pacearchaeota archaeon]
MAFLKNQEIKDYLYSLRFEGLLCFLIFLLGIFMGWIISSVDLNTSKGIIEELEKFVEPISKLNSFWQFIYIFLNNAFAALVVILSGLLFGIFPLLSLFSNGEILGILAFLSKGNLSLSTFLSGILPHGVIEIPIIVLAGASGIKIGKLAIEKIFFKKKIEIKKEISTSLKFFVKILLPFLFLAAMIEIFITPKLILKTIYY